MDKRWYMLFLLFLLVGCGQLTKDTANKAPVITGATNVLSPFDRITDGQSISLNVSATDPDGDQLSYYWWSVPSFNNFSSRNADTTSFTAPSFNGIYTPIQIFVQVSDGNDTTAYSWTYYLNYPTSNSGSGNDQPSANEQQYEQPVTVDPTITPSTPKGFYVNTQVSQLILKWSPVTTFMNGASAVGKIAKYRIYRAVSESGPFDQNTPFYLHAEVAANQTSFAEVAIGVRYWYKITAVSASGNESLQSGTAGSVDDAAPPVPAITGMRAYNPDSNAITVYWDLLNVADCAGYRIYRADAKDNGGLPDSDDNHDGVYELVGETGHSYFTDESITTTGNFWYRISAYDFSGNESAMSLYHEVNNIVPPPCTSFGGIAATASVTLFWQHPGVEDLAGFRIYYLPNDFNDFRSGILLADEEELTAAKRKYIFSGESGRTYTFHIIAVDIYGNYSPESQKISVAMP